MSDTSSKKSIHPLALAAGFAVVAIGVGAAVLARSLNGLSEPFDDILKDEYDPPFRDVRGPAPD